MIGKVNDACPKYMTLINIGYLSSQIQQFQLRGNSKNGRFPLTSMLTSLKNRPKCLTQNLILCLSSLHRENPMRIAMHITYIVQLSNDVNVIRYKQVFILFFFLFVNMKMH